MTQARPAPLIVTRDQALSDELMRLAAAAGVTPDLAGDIGAALRGWATAPVVLVGLDLAEGLAGAEPARRSGVHVLARGEVPTSAFRVALDLGAEGVADVARSESWVVELLADTEEVVGTGQVIGVVGGSGGAGATTFACALAQLAARDGPAAVIDLDPLGPGADAVLGIDSAVGVRWDGLVQTVGRVSARSLREALPRRHGVGVLGWGPTTGELPPFAVRQAVQAAQRGHGVVVADLPRRFDAVVDEVLPRCDQVVLVVRPSVVGVSSAQRLSARITHPRVGVLVRGAGIVPADVARLLGRPLLAAMGDQRGLAEAVDLGGGPLRSGRTPLARAARAVLDPTSDRASA